MKKKFLKLTAIILIFSLTSCSNENPMSRQSFMLNTLCEISIYSGKDKAVLNGAFDKITYYEDMFSTTVEGSDIYKLNHADGDFVEVSDDTIKILEDSKKYYELSGGLLDITLGNATSLWDFTGENNTLPDDGKIKAAILNIGCNNIIIDGTKVSLKNGVNIDLGAVAKGYIADRVREYLEQNGVSRAIINLGGNVIVMGSKSKNEDWTVGIRDPFNEEKTLDQNVSVSDKSVVTSGIYERYFKIGDKVYHHILDPKTGYPCETDIAGITIISDCSEQGDAFSTISLILGSEKAEKFMKDNGVSGIIVKKDKEIIKVE